MFIKKKEENLLNLNVTQIFNQTKIYTQIIRKISKVKKLLFKSSATMRSKHNDRPKKKEKKSNARTCMITINFYRFQDIHSN